MPTTIEDYQKVADRAQQLTASGGQFSSAATSLGPQVMEAVRADRVTRGVSQMATDVGNTMGQIPTDSAAIRARAGNMVNPTEVDTITAAQRGQNLRTLGTIATQAEYNQGTLKDILNEQANQLKAVAERKYAEAQAAQVEADSLMKKLGYELDVRKQNFYEDMTNKEFELAKNKAGTGGAGGSVFASTPEPLYTPKTGEGTKAGDWTFTGGKWVSSAVSPAASYEELWAAYAKETDTKKASKIMDIIEGRMALDRIKMEAEKIKQQSEEEISNEELAKQKQ